MLVVGLTGSIAMGKTETARMFARLGYPVFDADAVVHRLYDRGGAAVPLIERAFPGTVVDGKVDRSKLADQVTGDPDALARLESIVHPLVRREQQAFLEAPGRSGTPSPFSTSRFCSRPAATRRSTPSSWCRLRKMCRKTACLTGPG
jgi:dephospho-CoA kinase